MNRTQTLFAVAVTAAVVLPAAACGGQRNPQTTEPVPAPSPSGSTQQISESNLGYLWPLDVDHGTLRCDEGGEALFVSPDGTTYALNERAEQQGAPSIEPIRLSSGGHDVSLGAIRSMALKLC